MAVTSRTVARLSIPALAFALVVLPAAASAQEDATPPAALDAFRSARGHYEAGRYEEAIADLELAFRLDPRSPTLAYNLARVHELMGNLEDALRYYERYQELLPDEQARETDRADATIRRLNGALARRAPTEEVAPPSRPVEALRELPGLVRIRQRGVADTWFWLSLGSGVALLGIGATFGVLALTTRDDANDFVLRVDGPPATRQDELRERARAYALVADLTLALGGAATLAAVLLYLLREQTVERAPVPEDGAEAGLHWDPPALQVGANGGAVVLGGRW